MEAESRMLNPLDCGLSNLSSGEETHPVLSFDEVNKYLDVYETTGKIDKKLYSAIDIIYREAGEDLQKDVPLVIEFQYIEYGEQEKSFRIVNDRIEDYKAVNHSFIEGILDSERVLMDEEWMETFYNKFHELKDKLDARMTDIEARAREQCGDDYMDPDDKDIMFCR
jgi:hypothetical protein